LDADPENAADQTEDQDDREAAKAA
jgi:hypothetical protein